jgi:putative ABC transport system permease protein
MNPVIYLAWKYLTYHKAKTILLIISIALILFIPLGLNYLVNRSAEEFISRAVATPLVVGTKGSATDQTLNTLYFKEPSTDPLPYREFTSLQANAVMAIPLHTRFEAKGFRIAGTSLEYMTFRDLEIESGRLFTLLGECVLGAAVARATGLTVGETLISTPAGAFDVAGSFPLKMKVVGVLEPASTPDDQVIFTDIKTSWLIAGLAHGHQDVISGPDSLLLSKSDTNQVANASLLPYTEITEDNMDSFHFHGDISDYPVDAILVVPDSRREDIQLRGRFEERTDNVQVIVPERVISDLVTTMFSVRDSLVTAGIAVGLATMVIVVLVFWLSIKLRWPEINTMKKIGGSVKTINTILSLEIVFTIGISILVAVMITYLFGRFGLPLVEGLITG